MPTREPTDAMRIGIDARELCGKPTGVGRHLAGLLGAWATDRGALRHTLVLYAHEPITTPIPGAELRIVPGAGGTQWEQFALPAAAKRDRLDVFFAPGYTAPIAWSIPTVVLVHDISFVAHPEWFRWREGLRRRVITRWSSNRAKVVLTVSEAARREILAHFGLPAERVRCIYPGIASLVTSANASIRREPLVVFVGSIFNRRHIPDLIRAFAPIARSHTAARLEIVGDNRTFPREDLPGVVAREHLQNQVTLRPYVFDRELAALYARAGTCAWLSEYEGFGHPPLEALASGVPSVLLDTPVAREVCGDAALYVNQGDIAGITAALHSLLFDEGVRARILDAGPAVLARYSWDRAAADTLNILETAAGG
jgi:glycosyltransferase involved in cell wall biosynthesis